MFIITKLNWADQLDGPELQRVIGQRQQTMLAFLPLGCLTAIGSVPAYGIAWMGVSLSFCTRASEMPLIFQD